MPASACLPPHSALQEVLKVTLLLDDREQAAHTAVSTVQPLSSYDCILLDI